MGFQDFFCLVMSPVFVVASLVYLGIEYQSQIWFLISGLRTVHIFFGMLAVGMVGLFLLFCNRDYYLD